MINSGLYKRYEDKAPYTCTKDSLTWWFAFNDSKILIQNSKSEILIPQLEDLATIGCEISSKHYIGKIEGHNCFAVALRSKKGIDEHFSFIPLKALYSSVDDDIFFISTKASQIVHWDATHKFCGRCGHTTNELENQNAKVCPNCGFISYPVISPAVITAILKDDKILLAHNANFTENMYSLIAGFVEPGETLEEAAQREIMEEVGIKVKNVKYFGSQPWPFPNSLMLGFTAEYESGDVQVDGVEILKADWFTKDNMPEIPQKVSIARRIIDWYLNI